MGCNLCPALSWMDVQGVEDELAAKTAELTHVRDELARIAVAAGEAEAALADLQAKHAAAEKVRMHHQYRGCVVCGWFRRRRCT